jgi:hypothetical protein
MITAPTNQERAQRCGDALTTYSDDDLAANLIDFLADAMHWCYFNDYAFHEALHSAHMHFDAECGDAINEGGLDHGNIP